jgi:hypothetical protein
MAIEDDVAELQSQVSELQGNITDIQGSISELQSSITGIQSTLDSINTLLSAKAPIANPDFTGTVKVSGADLSTKQYVDDSIAASTTVAADSIPLPPAPIEGGGYDNDGNFIDYTSTGAIGTDSKYAKADHVHPADTTRAPIDSPVFSGVPRLDFTPEEGSAEYNGNCIANTAFVLQAIKNYIAVKPPATTPPSGEGELPQADKPGQPGGNSENNNIGGGGTKGIGGDGGDSNDSKTSGSSGDDGQRGTDGGDGSYSLKGTNYADDYNWDIGTYVHTPA